MKTHAAQVQDAVDAVDALRTMMGQLRARADWVDFTNEDAADAMRTLSASIAHFVALDAPPLLRSGTADALRRVQRATRAIVAAVSDDEWVDDVELLGVLRRFVSEVIVDTAEDTAIVAGDAAKRVGRTLEKVPDAVSNPYFMVAALAVLGVVVLVKFK
jgi:hypothetical protein